MRRWLPRSLWLLAWSCWAWLGWGLYWELPRDLPAPVSRLPFRDEEDFLGWLSDEPIAVTTERREDGDPMLVRLYDATTGRLLSTYNGPVDRSGAYSDETCLRHGVLVGPERPGVAGEPAWKNGYILHLRTGRWLPLPCPRPELEGFAPTKPYALFSRQEKPPPPPRIVDGVRVAPEPVDQADLEWRVLVVDLSDGRLVTKLTPRAGGQPSRSLYGAFFVGDDAIAVSTHVDLADDQEPSPDDHRLEVWRLDAPHRPARIIKGVETEFTPTVSGTGRVAWHRPGALTPFVDVLDLDEGRVIFSHPPTSERRFNPGGSSGSWPGPVIAVDGRSVYVPMQSTLWDVDRKTVLWKGDDLGGLFVFPPGDRFLMHERWTLPYLSFVFKLETYALRDMSTRRLVYRTWASTVPRSEGLNPWTEWHLDDQNNVYRLPPPVNWPLLALCQAILALPLVLLWAGLRWRRRRLGSFARVAS